MRRETNGRKFLKLTSRGMKNFIKNIVTVRQEKDLMRHETNGSKEVTL